MTKDFNYAAAPRTHMSHPHGVRVFQMIDQMFAGIARAAGDRGIRFHVVPNAATDAPGRQRNTGLIYRQHFTTGIVQVPLVQCVIDLTLEHPDRQAVAHVSQLLPMPLLLEHMDQFTRAHFGSLYGGCGLQFNEIAKLLRALLKTAGYHCLGKIELWPLAVPGTEQDRDMALIHLVLKDELDGETAYDYQITLIWNGPDRFQKMLFQALRGEPMA